MIIEKFNFTFKRGDGNVHLHEKIRAIRNFKGVKQKEMSDALGLTVQAYSNKERGVRPITTTELELIAEQLNVQTSIFFKDDFNVKFNDIVPEEVS